jgi:hypothetical protein
MPDNDQYVYGLARLRVQAGDTSDGLESLRRAIEMNARWREVAATSGDFDNALDHPGFRELLGG